MNELEQLDKELDALAAYESGKGYLHFLMHVMIDSQPERKPFRVIGESWQWERERERAGALDSVAGVNPGYTGIRSFWSGCAKGNDKSTGVARRLLYLLGWAKRPLQLYICSGKEEQAAVVTAAMKMQLDANPWIAERVSVSDLTGKGASGSELTVLPMKAATGQGIFPDYLVADELTHWQYEEGRKFWNFVIGSIRKRPMCMFEVLTNAGHIGSWQWEVRNQIKQLHESKQYWHFFEQPAKSQLASWMDAAAIERDGKLMDPGEKRRLLWNEWIDPGEERGYLTLVEAEACVDFALREESKGRRGEQYYLSVDYGGVNDRCSLTIGHPVKGTDRVVLDRLDCWQGSHEDRIQINKPEEGAEWFRSVEEYIDIAYLNFPNLTLIFDPYQMESLAQKYERRGRRVKRFEFRGGKSNYEMAQLLRNYVQSKKLSWSPWAGLLEGAEDDTFAKELARLVKKPMIYGYRFDHEAGRHDDRASSVGGMLVVMVPEMPPVGQGPKVLDKKDDESGYTGNVRGIPIRQDWAVNRNLFGMGTKP